MDTFTTEDRRRAFPDYGEYTTPANFDLAIRIASEDTSVCPHPAYPHLLRFLKRKRADIDVRLQAVQPGVRHRLGSTPIAAPVLFFYNAYDLITIHYHWSADPAEDYVARTYNTQFAVWDGKIWYEPSSKEELHEILLRFERIYESEFASDND